AQARTAHLNRITRWAYAAMGAVIVIAGGIVGWLQWDKARQLARQEVALAESKQQLDEARTNVSAEQASNAALNESLKDKARQLETQQERLAESGRQLGEARANVSAEHASNAALKESLNSRQVEIDHAQANILAELSAAKLSRSDFDGALRLA